MSAVSHVVPISLWAKPGLDGARSSRPSPLLQARDATGICREPHHRLFSPCTRNAPVDHGTVLFPRSTGASDVPWAMHP